MQKKLSSLLWGICWERFFPLKLQDTPYIFSLCDTTTAFEFMQSRGKDIYPSPGSDTATPAFLPHDFSQAKMAYYEYLGDFISVHHQHSPQEMVGLLTSTVQDWSTYYVRNASILPGHQGKKILQNYLLFLISVLRNHGVERMETDISPSHLGQVHVLNKLSFNITGQNLSERWGAQLRLTRFLRERNEEVFIGRFCYGISPQIKRCSPAK